MYPTERNYEIGNMEMLAIIKSCGKWQHYVEDTLHQIRMITDQYNLKKKNLNKNLNRRKIRWWKRFSVLNLLVKYGPGYGHPLLVLRHPSFA